MQTPVRQTPWKRAIGIATWTAAALLGGGCQRDVEQADVRVKRDVQNANDKLASRNGGADGIQILQKAAKEPASSNIAKVYANAQLAQAEVTAGDVLLPPLDSSRAKVSRLLARIDAVALQVQNNNLTLAAFRAREPKASLEASKKTADGVQGAGKAPWVAADQGAIPSLGAVNDQINSLNSDIQKLNDERKKLVGEQSAADQQARDQFVQADQASGQKSVDLFTQASDSRKTAMERSIQVDGVDAKLLPLGQQLAVATQQKTQLDAAAAVIQKQSEELTKGWTDVQEQIKSQGALSENLVGSPAAKEAGAAPTSQPKSASDSLAQLGAELTTNLADVDKLRKDAETHYKNALAAVELALKAAKQVETAYGATLLANNLAPQKDAWQAIIESHKPAGLTLRRAELQQRLADLYAGAARDADSQAKTVAAVKASLEQGTLTMPDSLADKGATDVAATFHKQAEEMFVAADTDLLNVIQMPSSGDLVKGVVASARVARIIELYAHAQSVQDQKQSGELMGEAKQIVADLQSGTAPLPSFLPPELAPPPPPTTEPATPTTAPSTAPATVTPQAPAAVPAPGTPATPGTPAPATPGSVIPPPQ